MSDTGSDAPVPIAPAANARVPIERVIVVDDDPVIRGILRSTLAGFGVGVHLAADGAEAVTLAARLQAGLFILDLQMPRMNGLQTLQHLRSLERHAATPIIILTGFDGARTEAAAMGLGATVFLTKPFKPASLLRMLTPILRGEGPADLTSEPADVWNGVHPEYRKQLWGRLDARRAAASRARGDNDLLPLQSGFDGLPKC